MRQLILALIILFACSCERHITRTEYAPHPLKITVKSDGFDIRNTEDCAYAVAVFNVKILPLIYWAPSCREDNTIEPGETLHVDAASLNDFTSGEEFVVYWWTCPWDAENSADMGSQNIQL